NPANFGRDARWRSIHYLDDEWYPRPRVRDLAAAMVRRVPEEPDIGESEWRSWGKVLAAVLEPLCTSGAAWDELLDEVRAFPLADAFGARRAALREGLASTR
ncbi:MAG: hypothetical protein GWO02_12265, partial [Gammaproteobacteria bacterium]|nr:hypothetical protein [Gammaproteobacteria bacterium]